MSIEILPLPKRRTTNITTIAICQNIYSDIDEMLSSTLKNDNDK